MKSASQQTAVTSPRNPNLQGLLAAYSTHEVKVAKSYLSTILRSRFQQTDRDYPGHHDSEDRR